MTKIVLFNKPFGVISQFREHEKYPTLANYLDDKSLRVSGRLDTDSEGLLLLTDDGAINAAITQPKNKKYKTYLAQVEGEPNKSQLAQLTAGVVLKDGKTLPAQVKQVDTPKLWERDPPVRFRKTVPTSWLELIICEGKNRQVRRMTAAVGLPTLRLVRVQVGAFTLGDLALGAWVQINLSKQKRQKLLQG